MPPAVHGGAEGELFRMRRDDRPARIRIDTDDPVDRNALFERMIRHARG